MTPTERLRELLDERGVEWDGTEAVTFWNDCSSCAFDGNNGEKLTVHFRCTPEQAVEATLGRKPDERLAARMTDVMMRVELALGVDHGGVEVLSSDVVPLLGEALAIIEDAVVVGRGECGYDETDTYAAPDVHVLECTECGGTYEHVNGAYEFCPRCGRKVRGDV